MKAWKTIAACALFAFSSLPAQAVQSEESFTVHTAIIAPYISEASGGQTDGIIMEIMTAALAAAGMDFNVQDAIPWRRAQSEAIDLPNSLISPFARTPGREDNWTWITILLDENMLVYVPAGADGPNNAEELVNAGSVGVLAGGAPDSVAVELGLEGAMQPVPSEDMNAAKVAAGRLDAWISQSYMAAAGWREAGVDPSTIESRFVLRELPLWVATSKSTSPEMVEKLRAAFENFVGSPEYNEILSRYQ